MYEADASLTVRERNVLAQSYTLTAPLPTAASGVQVEVHSREIAFSTAFTASKGLEVNVFADYGYGPNPMFAVSIREVLVPVVQS